jgi:hypothetical protein
MSNGPVNVTVTGAAGQIGDERGIAHRCGNLAHRRAAEFHEILRLKIARLAEAHDDKAMHVETGRRDEVKGGPVLAFEPIGRCRPLYQLFRRPNGAPRHRAEFEPLFAEQDENPLGGRAKAHKFKLQAARHEGRLLSNGHRLRAAKVETGFADAIKLAPNARKSRG